MQHMMSVMVGVVGVVVAAAADIRLQGAEVVEVAVETWLQGAVDVVDVEAWLQSAVDVVVGVVEVSAGDIWQLDVVDVAVVVGEASVADVVVDTWSLMVQQLSL